MYGTEVKYLNGGVENSLVAFCAHSSEFRIFDVVVGTPFPGKSQIKAPLVHARKQASDPA